MNDSFIPAALAAADEAGPGGVPARHRSSRLEIRDERLGTAAPAPVEAS